MTRAELAEIKERAELTPGGSWFWTSASLESGDFQQFLLWACQDANGRLYIGVQDEVAEFIRHARADVLKLVAELERRI